MKVSSSVREFVLVQIYEADEWTEGDKILLAHFDLDNDQFRLPSPSQASAVADLLVDYSNLADDLANDRKTPPEYRAWYRQASRGLTSLAAKARKRDPRYNVQGGAARLKGNAMRKKQIKEQILDIVDWVESNDEDSEGVSDEIHYGLSQLWPFQSEDERLYVSLENPHWHNHNVPSTAAVVLDVTPKSGRGFFSYYLRRDGKLIPMGKNDVAPQDMHEKKHVDRELRKLLATRVPLFKIEDWGDGDVEVVTSPWYE